MKKTRFAVFIPDPSGEIEKKLAEMATRDKRNKGQQLAMLIERDYDERIPVKQAAQVEPIQV